MENLKERMLAIKDRWEIVSPIVTEKTTQLEQTNSESPSWMMIDDDNTKIISTIKRRKDSDYTALILSWGVGVGKTYLSKNLFPDYYFVPEVYFKQLNVAWQLRLRSPDEYKTSMRDYPLEWLMKLEWVIYDDYWSAEKSEAYIEKMLFRLQRIDKSNRRTIITTNLTPEEMKDRDERIYSRMMQNAVVLVLWWPDRRIQRTKIVNVL